MFGHTNYAWQSCITPAMQQNSLIGREVGIHPIVFKDMIVKGTLVGSDDTRWIVA